MDSSARRYLTAALALALGIAAIALVAVRGGKADAPPPPPPDLTAARSFECTLETCETTGDLLEDVRPELSRRNIDPASIVVRGAERRDRNGNVVLRQVEIVAGDEVLLHADTQRQSGAEARLSAHLAPQFSRVDWLALPTGPDPGPGPEPVRPAAPDGPFAWLSTPAYAILGILGMVTLLCGGATLAFGSGARAELTLNWTARLSTFIAGMIMSLALPGS